MRFLTILAVMVVFMAIIGGAEEQNSVANEAVELAETGNHKNRVVRQGGRFEDSESQEYQHRPHHRHHQRVHRSGQRQGRAMAPAKSTNPLTASHLAHNNTKSVPEHSETDPSSLVSYDLTHGRGLSVSNKLSEAEQAHIDKEFEAYMPTNQQQLKLVSEIDADNDKIMKQYGGGLF